MAEGVFVCGWWGLGCWQDGRLTNTKKSQHFKKKLLFFSPDLNKMMKYKLYKVIKRPLISFIGEGSSVLN